MKERKKIVLIGGLGTIGRILEKGLEDTYEVLVLDIAEPVGIPEANYTKADVTQLDQLLKVIPDDAHALINLSGLPKIPSLADPEAARHSIDVYVVGSYNVLLAATIKGIGKVIFASSNHVTGAYEIRGLSLLGRKIRTDDYPLPDSAYGAMKLCGELFGYSFWKEKNISVICLRIGTVVRDELSQLRSDERSHRTILSKRDTVNIFKSAIETEIKYGVYYAVSDNPDNPWDITDTMDKLGFHPEQNSVALQKGRNRLKVFQKFPFLGRKKPIGRETQ
ncbi:MAG: NAD(P)-dependent oxidoreductase [Acidobacteriota bacterium]